MLLHFPEGVTPESFLQLIWQKRPLLMRQALPGYRCPLSAEELAGLACEDGVESRIVLEKDGSRPWELRHGPFPEGAFAALPVSHWTLLVQDVDKWIPAVADLLDAFRFIPSWRLDDVMVSYAADAGSVGPHWDEYDVFLVQAQGRRHWRIGDQPSHGDDSIPELELRIMREFDPARDWLLEPGDVLYLPPRIPHWGVADGPCMTCSVGFRSPALKEMLSAWFADHLERVADTHYRDRGLLRHDAGGEIDWQVLQAATELLTSALPEPAEQTARWFGRFMTETKPPLQPEALATPLEPVTFHAEFEARGVLQRHPGARLAFACDDTVCTLFASGHDWQLPRRLHGFLQVLTRDRHLHFGFMAAWLDDESCLDLLCRLFNAGQLEFGDE